MNPGYLSLVVVTIFMILLASGWKETILGEWSNKQIALFLTAWFAGRWITLHGEHVRFNLSYAAVVLVTVGLWFSVKPFSRKIHLLAVGMMLASFHYFLMELFRANPFLSTVNPDIETALWVCGLAVMITRQPGMQLFVLSFALLLGQTYFDYANRETIPVYLGSPKFMDKWWFALISARMGTLLLHGLIEMASRTKRVWGNASKAREDGNND